MLFLITSNCIIQIENHNTYIESHNIDIESHNADIKNYSSAKNHKKIQEVI